MCSQEPVRREPAACWDNRKKREREGRGQRRHIYNLQHGGERERERDTARTIAEEALRACVCVCVCVRAWVPHRDKSDLTKCKVGT